MEHLINYKNRARKARFPFHVPIFSSLKDQESV
jgi:hypothetical protein